MKEIEKKIQDANNLHDEMKEYFKPSVNVSDTINSHIYMINKNRKHIFMGVVILFFSIIIFFICWKPSFLTYTKKDDDGIKIKCILKYRLLKLSLFVTCLLYICLLFLSDKFVFIKKIIYNT